MSSANRYFKDVPVGAEFRHDSTVYQKHSEEWAMTLRMIDGGEATEPERLVRFYEHDEVSIAAKGR